MTDLYCTS